MSLLALAAAYSVGAMAADDRGGSCMQDAMLVFDASGSMAGTDMNSISPRIGKVRQALEKVLPEVASERNLGLIVYGPGPYNVCETVDVRLRPAPNSAERIMAEVNAVSPAGRTPLTTGVRTAAEVLGYKSRAATIVLITDGEETCGGDPCALAQKLKAEGQATTVHVIGYKDKLAIKGPFGSRCLADTTGGEYVAVETTDQLVAALHKALGCPFITQRRVAPQPAILQAALSSRSQAR
ncbi:MAG: VWA domain-containing protein [Hyphomicrobium sp.]|jgi:Ca-activated chloride channel family protein